VNILQLQCTVECSEYSAAYIFDDSVKMCYLIPMYFVYLHQTL